MATPKAPYHTGGRLRSAFMPACSALQRDCETVHQRGCFARVVDQVSSSSVRLFPASLFRVVARHVSFPFGRRLRACSFEYGSNRHQRAAPKRASVAAIPRRALRLPTELAGRAPATLRRRASPLRLFAFDKCKVAICDSRNALNSRNAANTGHFYSALPIIKNKTNLPRASRIAPALLPSAAERGPAKRASEQAQHLNRLCR
jgi:hypothetical protein